MAKSAKIKVVDIFAGPGGLGEGFSSFLAGSKAPFKIVLSAEKESVAHQTLTLRAFFRRFKSADVPEEYYQIVRGEIEPKDLEGTLAKEWKEAEKKPCSWSWAPNLSDFTRRSGQESILRKSLGCL